MLLATAVVSIAALLGHGGGAADLILWYFSATMSQRNPCLDGSDTQLHELMIFFSTLGGIIMFGFAGFIIGPIVAALFVTIWEIYGLEFRHWLPETHFMTRAERESEEEVKKQANAGVGPDRQV